MCSPSEVRHSPWFPLLPVALLVLAAGCGGGESTGDLSAERVAEPRPAGEATAREGEQPPLASPGLAPAAPWFHRVGGPQDDVGTGLAVDGEGHVSLVWLSTPREDADRAPVEGERLALSVARHDARGERLWTREFPRNRVDAPRVVASPGGELFVSGNAFLYDIDFGLGAASDGFLVKFSPAGEPLWQRRVGQKVYATAADGAGGVLALGAEWTSGGFVPVIAHYDAQGAALWSRQLPGAGSGTELRAAALTASGEWLVAGRLEGALTVDGQTLGAPGETSLGVLAFGRDGGLVRGQARGGRDVHVSGLRATADGGGVLVGDFSGALPWGGSRLSGPGAFVLSVGADGTERWARELACGHAPAAPAVALDGEGQVAAACGDTLSRYSSEGEQSSEHALTPGECSGQDCAVTVTALEFVPGQGLALTGSQRHGDAVDGNQEAFVRVLAP